MARTDGVAYAMSLGGNPVAHRRDMFQPLLRWGAGWKLFGLLTAIWAIAHYCLGVGRAGKCSACSAPGATAPY